MAGHAQLKFVMTECSKTQIRLTGLIFQILMHLWLDMLVVLVASVNAFPAISERLLTDDGDEASKMRDMTLSENYVIGVDRVDQVKDSNREERSLFMSWSLIMRGARSCGFCTNHKANRKVYQKAGGLDQAKRDFDFLDPTSIKIYADGSKTGFAGQRLIHLESREIPSLYISGNRGAINKGQESEIFYFKHMPDESNKIWESMLWQKDTKYINKVENVHHSQTVNCPGNEVTYPLVFKRIQST